jgi:hypothetical protein
VRTKNAASETLGCNQEICTASFHVSCKQVTTSGQLDKETIHTTIQVSGSRVKEQEAQEIATGDTSSFAKLQER